MISNRKKLIAALSLLAATLPLSGQNLLSVRKTPSSAVVLEWASDPQAMYRIEASTLAVTNITWETVQENLPTQGTNTFWADNGSDGPSGRLSSADPNAPFRFYRVAVERYMSNTSPISVTINNCSEGAVLSDAVNVSASATATQGIGAISLYIDGQKVSTESGTSVTLPLETRSYANGPHRLSVIAMDAEGLESTGSSNTLGASYGSTNITVVFQQQYFKRSIWTQGISARLGTIAAHCRRLAFTPPMAS
jgi:hypothetical protein